MTDHEVVPVQPELPMAAITSASMPRLFELAVQKGAEGVEILERLVALDERMSARRAAQEFAEAMAKFKAICPPVPRRTENPQFTVTRNGTKYPRLYSSLEDIEAAIRGPLGECGLSFRWGDASVSGDILTLPCIVSHVGGHSVSASVPVSTKSNAGCSEAQKIGAVMTYAQRFSLVAALGLTTCDEDVDGNAEPEERVTPTQVDILETLIGACPDGTRTRFMQYVNAQWGCGSLDDIPASAFEQLCADLKKKAQAQR